MREKSTNLKTMKLRKLKQKDASLMLEWMHDLSIVKQLNKNFETKTLHDCIDFINFSQSINRDMHLAIVDSDDVYMGTVSLKNITEKNAEFAITVRKSAMGKGYSQYAMTEMLRIGFEELGLNEIYWYVDSENKRAVRFYDKNGYHRIPKICQNNMWGAAQNRHYIYYKEKRTNMG